MENKTRTEVKALKAHIAINVSDVNQSTEFYRKMLGLEPCKVRTGYAKFDVQNPPLNLTLNERKGVTAGALSHLGIQVNSTDDVTTIRKTWVEDPDGNQWEVFVVLEDNLAASAVCCTSNSAEPISIGR